MDYANDLQGGSNNNNTFIKQLSVRTWKASDIFPFYHNYSVFSVQEFL